jgi:hypothetical protein
MIQYILITILSIGSVAYLRKALFNLLPGPSDAVKVNDALKQDFKTSILKFCIILMFLPIIMYIAHYLITYDIDFIIPTWLWVLGNFFLIGYLINKYSKEMKL